MNSQWLRTDMSPYITQVHIKDAKVIKEGKEWGMKPVVQGSAISLWRDACVNFYC
jgi:hypothetical protein